MRNNQIINSSIIINIIVNGKNETAENPTTVPSQPWTEASALPNEIDPGFWMHSEQMLRPEPAIDQQLDTGRLKIKDRYERPFVLEAKLEEPLN